MEKNMIEQRTENENTGSTGSLGFAYRSYNRAYINFQGVIHDAGYVARLGRIGNELIKRRRKNVTRGVLRALIPHSVLMDVLDNPESADLVESVVPIRYLTGANGRSPEPLWMMLAAVNHPERTPYTPVRDMATAVDDTRRRKITAPAVRIPALEQEGYRFIRNIPADRIAEIRRLWADSFEWNTKGIRQLRETLTSTQSCSRAQRRVWFSGLVEPRSGRLVSLATAERLDLPVGDGRTVPVVENTEWRGIDSKRRGLTAAVVAHLNAQILDDIGDLNPLIIAEANYRSGAHHVGYAAGMEIPPRSISGRPVRQMLIQNVRVGDGCEPDGPRDFSMMYLNQSAIQMYYDRASRLSMLKGTV